MYTLYSKNNINVYGELDNKNNNEIIRVITKSDDLGHNSIKLSYMILDYLASYINSSANKSRAIFKNVKTNTGEILFIDKNQIKVKSYKVSEIDFGNLKSSNIVIDKDNLFAVISHIDEVYDDYILDIIKDM